MPAADLSRIPSKYRKDLVRWLDVQFVFTHFVTLTTHDQSLSRSRMRDLVKEWDARINRALFGPKWRSHQDELIFAFAFIEKADSNPHWHLLIRLMEPDEVKRRWQAERLEPLATEIWQKLAPSGTVVVKKITHGHDRVANYVAKEVGNALQFQDFITPDEFRRY